jgi:hypothetical protein
MRKTETKQETDICRSTDVLAGVARDTKLFVNPHLSPLARRRYPGSEPTGSGKFAHQISPRYITNPRGAKT